MTSDSGNESDPVMSPLRILLGSGDARLSTRKIAEQLHVSQPTVVRRLAQAREAWGHTRRREFWRTTMYALLTVSAVVAAVSLAILAATLA
jgi:hypothetical protein